MHVILRVSLLIILRVCVSVNGIPRVSVQVPPQAYMLAVAVPQVSLLFFPTHSCEVTLAMDLIQLMSTYGVLLVIPYIISRNLYNVAT